MDELKNWQQVWTHTFSAWSKTLTNKKIWKPYEPCHNWFSGLKFVSQHLTSQASQLLDTTKTYAQRLSNTEHNLKQDFSKDAIAEWIGDEEPIFPVTEYTDQLLALIRTLQSKSSAVLRDLQSRKRLLDNTIAGLR